jgi:hypothetical protein
MSKQQALILKVSGLYTNPNQFSEVPDGSLNQADNCVIDKGGVIESRRGFKQYGTVLTVGTGIVNSLHIYKTRLLASYDDKLAYDSDGAGTWTAYSGTYSPVSGYKIQSIQQNGNLYFTTDAGLKKIQSLTGTVGSAGIPKALDGSGATTGAGGFLVTGYNVAYRIVWGLKDDNNNLLLGAPSGRLIVANAAGANRNVSLTFIIPAGITTSYFFQVYRSPQVVVASEPTDELQLVYETNPTAGEITAKSLTFTDITDDTLRGAFLYTSSSQEGILQANDQPPVARDIALYKQMLFYGNTSAKQRMQFTLIATGATGITNGSTITISGVVYTGAAAENAATGTFKVFTAGSVSENIENTAFSLINVINTYATNTTVYAYYTSGFNDLPGRMVIEERSVGGAVFYALSSVGAAFNPTLPSAGTSFPSDNDTAQNRVYYSKLNQPEAVPLLNFLAVGSADFAIERVIPLRDSVFVFKKDGMFRIIGEDPTTLRLSVFDNTTEIIAKNSAVEIANTIYCYSDQGVVSASENGLQVMSRPIEDILFRIERFTDFDSTAFSIAYESDRKFIFFCKTVSGDEYPTQAFVYNQFTNAWTRWERNATCGIVLDAMAYLADADGNVYQERKNFDLDDYTDEEYAITITSSSGTTVNYTGTASVEVGSLLKQSTLEATVVSYSSGVLVVDEDLAWTAAAATLYSPINCEIEWVQQSGGNPGILKRFREVTLIMRDSSFRTIDMGFATNFATVPEYVTIESVLLGGWGAFAWGGLPWGGGSSTKPLPIRTYVPVEKARGSWMYLRVRSDKAKSNFAISGASIIYTPMSERFI